MNSIMFAQQGKNKLIAIRRDLHQYAETGWTEYRTASKVAVRLSELGYTIAIGKDVLEVDSCMGRPSAETAAKEAKRAVAQGADPIWVGKMAGSMTAVVGTMIFSDSGPTVAFRFDMDCNDVIESPKDKHLPAALGFQSKNAGCMHACGHDAHTAIGLLLAEYVAMHKGEWEGTLKLIFQPAEEGCRGAKGMADAGVVDDVDYFFAMHVGMGNKSGSLAAMAKGFLATTKLDAEFSGIASHAGASPEAGRNALLAACTAVLNLQAISRSSQGMTRINVGVLRGGTGRNVIPANAHLALETRGETTALNEYMKERAIAVLNGAAAMQGVTASFSEVGGATGATNDEELGEYVYNTAVASGLFEQVDQQAVAGGSEDCTYFMDRVAAHGGKAVYMILGMNIPAPHHNEYFDIDEAVLPRGVALLGLLAEQLLAKKQTLEV